LRRSLSSPLARFSPSSCVPLRECARLRMLQARCDSTLTARSEPAPTAAAERPLERTPRTSSAREQQQPTAAAAAVAGFAAAAALAATGRLATASATTLRSTSWCLAASRTPARRTPRRARERCRPGWSKCSKCACQTAPQAKSAPLAAPAPAPAAAAAPRSTQPACCRPRQDSRTPPQRPKRRNPKPPMPKEETTCGGAW
jgi:hypothetical protein